MQLKKNLSRGGPALLAIILFGTFGYMIIEGWSFLDSLYMTVITITTVGFNEVHTPTTGGRVFTIILAIGGVGAALFILTTFMEYLVEIRLGKTWRRRKMEQNISKLSDHLIICGFGRVGQEIARTFADEHTPFVVVESNAEETIKAEKAGYLYVWGDAADDIVLKKAGLEKARGLVSAVGDDAANTYIVLSARQQRSDMFIAARASGPSSESKLTMAGANRVISPYSIGARRMAMLALRPRVVEFIDMVTGPRKQDFQLESVEIADDSPLAGRTVGDVKKKTNVSVLAVTSRQGKLLANPSRDHQLDAGSRVIIIGTEAQMASLESVYEEQQTSE